MGIGARNVGSFAIYRNLFLLAALYDIVLGAAFIFLNDPILDALAITPPDNKSYIHLSAVFVLVQGLSYLFVYRDLAGNVDMIQVGIIYKAAYIAVAIYYLAIDELVHSVFLLFAMLDVAFMGLFIAALLALKKASGVPEGDRGSP